MNTNIAKSGGPCWEPGPDDVGHCTDMPDHEGPHRDFYAHTEWPNTTSTAARHEGTTPC